MSFSLFRIGRSGPGRIRIKLAELIEAEGLDCRPEDLEPAQGKWRNKTLDGMDGTRWWGTAYVVDFRDFPAKFRIHFNGYDTMTDCVKKGIEITPVDGLGSVYSYEVYAKSKEE